MSTVTLETEAQPYRGNREHLADEMRRLNLRLRICVSKARAQNACVVPDRLRGLVVFDEDVDRVLEGHQDKFASEETDGIEVRELEDELERMDSLIWARRMASRQNGGCLALEQLADAFGLSAFAQQTLMVCLAPEMLRGCEKLYGYLHDDITQKRPTVGLCLDLLCRGSPQRMNASREFDCRAPLVRWGLLSVGDHSEGASFISRSLTIDSRIADHLMGSQRLDARLQGLARMVRGRRTRSGFGITLSSLKRSPAIAQPRHGRVLYISGPYGSGRHRAAKALAAQLKRPLVLCDGQELAERRDFEQLVQLSVREAVLRPAVLCIGNLDALLEDDTRVAGRRVQALLRRVNAVPLTILLGNRSWAEYPRMHGQRVLAFACAVPEETGRKALWEAQLRRLKRKRGIAPGVDIASTAAELGGKFRFTAGQIRDAVRVARESCQLRRSGRLVQGRDLHEACRSHSHHDLSAVTQRIVPRHTIDDLVIPEDSRRQIEEIGAWVAYRQTVVGDWGFSRRISRGGGVSVLFIGPSGSGKTMCAEALGAKLGLEVHCANVAALVSKYIGETERNLSRVFEAAEAANAILFFDEADALFGKRSEVRDAHDRYANLEISYLLQRMESYSGLAILATNLKQNLDEAFIRRLAFTVHFPFPDEDARREIWRRIFPTHAPLARDIDFDRLAHEFKLSGGNIRNIAVAAAYLAASNGRLITMEHILAAVGREFQKMGKVVVPGEGSITRSLARGMT